MQVIVIEGTKGAGKTTAIAATKAALEERGLHVAVHAPFALGNERYADQGGIFLCWQDAEAAREAIAWLRIDAETAVANAVGDGVDVLLFDRHWLTVVCSIEDTVLSPEEKDVLRQGWLAAPPPTVFLYCSPELTLERRQGQLDRKSGLDSPELVVRDYERRVGLARAVRGVSMLQAPEADAGAVVAEVLRLAGAVKPTITRSIGMPIAGQVGSVPGGGYSGITDDLDGLVARSAEALRQDFQMDVSIRFNSDRRRGGAWLETTPGDQGFGNADVGITAQLVSASHIRASSKLRLEASEEEIEAHLRELGFTPGGPDETIRLSVYVGASYLRDAALATYGATNKRYAYQAVASIDEARQWFQDNVQMPGAPRCSALKLG